MFFTLQIKLEGNKMAKYNQKLDIHSELTNQVIEMLESAQDWERPWKKFAVNGMPINYKTKAIYNGANIISLWLSANKNGFKNNFWLTYNQAKELGGNVKKGSKGTHIIFYKPLTIEDKDTGEEKNIPILKWSTVFNIDQIENIDFEIEEPKTEKENIDFSGFENVDQVIENTGVIITHGGSRAFYSRNDDAITMPEKNDFNSAPDYYETLLHELTHWTGAPHRLERKKGAKFGDHDYAFEELIAELGSIFLCAELGIDGNLQNHASYIKSWIKALKSDKTFIFKASAQASKAFNFTMNLMYPEEQKATA